MVKPNTPDERVLRLRLYWHGITCAMSDPAFELDSEAAVLIIACYHELREHGEQFDPFTDAMVRVMVRQLWDANVDGDEDDHDRMLEPDDWVEERQFREVQVHA